MQKFRQTVRDGSVLIGTFIKTAAHQIPEVIAASGLDFAIIDAEHAAFGSETLDRMIMAGRGAGLPCLVRVPELASAPIGQVLDLGAAGVVVPHVATDEAAMRPVAMVRATRRLIALPQTPRARSGVRSRMRPRFSTSTRSPPSIRWIACF